MKMATQQEILSGVEVGRTRKGLLITPDLCIACRACQTACKQWNRLPGDHTVNHGSYENPLDLTPHLYNQIHFIEKPEDIGVSWLFLRRACFHCGKAGCMDICPAPGAITRTDFGAVVYDKQKCIACKLCVGACPFNVPRYDANGKISKCHLCHDRVSNGLPTACAKACPTGAIKFGGRGDLIATAKAADYTVYGENDLEGLGVMFALSRPREAYGLPEPRYNASISFWDNVLRPLTVIGLGAGIAGAVLHYLTVGPKEVEPPEEGKPREGGQ
jgi:formate dehydrogenase iron-sulfur subunit